jgi:chromate transporter
MHRFLVGEHHWLTETQFNASVALAQAAPGPNLLIIALLAWNVGINAGGSVGIGLISVFVAMMGMLIPSSTLVYMVSGWLQRNRELRTVRAFKQGLAPIVTALLIATGWIMASAHSFSEWQPWSVTVITTLLIWRTRIHMLWLIGTGALLGWFGYI